MLEFLKKDKKKLCLDNGWSIIGHINTLKEKKVMHAFNYYKGFLSKQFV